MKTQKLIPISLFGLAVNSVCNAVFLLQIARMNDAQLLTQSMVMWSGFFVTGACIAPFESYFLYKRISHAQEESHVKVVILSCSLFLLVGISLYLAQGVSLSVVPLTSALGFCVGKVVYLRSSAISQKNLVRVALSNSVEGFVRALILFILINRFGEIGLVSVMIAYLSGNLASMIPYSGNINRQSADRAKSIPTVKLYTLTLVGLLISLISGGIPYLAGLFQINLIGKLLFFFTFSRSFLILQSLFVYVNPHLAKKLGEKTVARDSLKFFLLLLTIAWLALSLSQVFLQKIMGINLSEIQAPDILLFSLALVLGAFLNLKVASVNVSLAWKRSLVSGTLGLLASSFCFLLIPSGKASFLIAMTAGPLIALLTSILADKVQGLESNNV